MDERPDGDQGLAGAEGYPEGARGDRLTHADWFSGIGGFSIAFERAGFRTVSFSEIEPFPCDTLARHWPDVPNIGDITKLGSDGLQLASGRFGVPADGALGADHGVPGDPGSDADDARGEAWRGEGSPADGGGQPDAVGEGRSDAVRAGWHDAFVWTGGFPCQDVSLAGARRGLVDDDGALTRSGLAFTWFALVQKHRPPWIIIENVPGLLSSNDGADMATILGTLEQLGYGWAYRTLDAQHFGVPQRRRRVFIVAALGDPAAVGPREVLALTEGGSGDPDPGQPARANTTDRFADGIGGAGILSQAVNSKWHKGSSGPAGDEHHNLVVGTIREHVRPGSNTDHSILVHREEADASGVREAAGVPGRVDGDAEGLIPDISPTLTAPENRRRLVDGKRQDGARTDKIPVVAATLNSGGAGGGFRTEPGEHLVFRKAGRAQTNESPESWDEEDMANTLNTFDQGDSRATNVIVGGSLSDADDLLPKGQDSARYKAIGNAIAVPVVEWIARRLHAYVEDEAWAADLEAAVQWRS